MSKNLFIIASLLLISGCQTTTKNADQWVQGKTNKDKIAVVGKIAGRMEEIRVSQGDHVRRGDTLAVLDIPEIDAKSKQAEGALRSAQAQYAMAQKGATENQMRQLEAKRQALQEQLNFAQKSLQRTEAMVQDSLIPQQQYDEVFAKYQGALAQLHAVQAEIADVSHGVRREQQLMAQGQQDRAQGALLEVRTAEKERYILAPQDMTIDNVTLKIGELALPGYTLFTGVLESATTFRFTIAESELRKYPLHSNITVYVPYLENRAVAGQVQHIKQIGAYANIATAYPDYKMQDALFELTIKPENSQDAQSILENTTVLIKK